MGFNKSNENSVTSYIKESNICNILKMNKLYSRNKLYKRTDE